MLNRVVMCTLIAGIVLMLGGCTSSKSVRVWKDSEQSIKAGNVLVVGLSPDIERRRLFEVRLSRELRQVRISATPSTEVLGVDEPIDRDSLQSHLANTSFDSVIVTRLVGVENRSNYVPSSSYRNFYHYYTDAHTWAFEPGFTFENRVFSLETNLYDIASESLIWSMQSEAFESRRIYKLIEDLAELIAKEMSRSGII